MTHLKVLFYANEPLGQLDLQILVIFYAYVFGGQKGTHFMVTKLAK